MGNDGFNGGSGCKRYGKSDRKIVIDIEEGSKRVSGVGRNDVGGMEKGGK